MKFILPLGVFCMLLSCCYLGSKLPVSPNFPLDQVVFLPQEGWKNIPEIPSFNSEELLKNGVFFFNDPQEETDCQYHSNKEDCLGKISKMGKLVRNVDSNTMITALHPFKESHQSEYPENSLWRLTLLY